ncbi:hsp70 nucleotide exchange factor FES1-like [Panicum miliaceum]|uniref:Hsp70 nucleotide exchange factor FES1-like n=1 Tax=Panicum miliaceum TaxID=4540 RepID=A0A3L6QTM0_PANMI|nr:hsp70 nucleotide exchange factor FES1-like [Panicum miliaceum]
MAGPKQPRRYHLPAILAAIVAAPLLLFSPAVRAVEKGTNRSSLLGQPRQWATGKDEAEILAEAEARGGGGGGNSPAGDQGQEFESLDSMLQWAIGNSDPDKLREKAAELETLSADELLKRQMEIKLVEMLKMPSDAELMKTAIADLNNSSVSLEDRKRALQELLVLVEPIDNTNDLEKLGGLIPLIKQLNNADEGIRATSAWVLGKASQNNALEQNQILGYGALKRLVNMGYSSSAAEAAKALYAISSLIRDNEHGQELFLSENGYAMLQHILSTAGNSARLQKKVVSLLAYVADFHLSTGKSQASFLSNHLFIKSVVDMISAPDIDLQEKALLAVKSLLQLTSDDAADLQKFSDLDDSLDALRVQLDELTSREERREYALEVEILRREVQIVFQQKFNQVRGVATSHEK